MSGIVDYLMMRYNLSVDLLFGNAPQAGFSNHWKTVGCRLSLVAAPRQSRFVFNGWEIPGL